MGDVGGKATTRGERHRCRAGGCFNLCKLVHDAGFKGVGPMVFATAAEFTWFNLAMIVLLLLACTAWPLGWIFSIEWRKHRARWIEAKAKAQFAILVKPADKVLLAQALAEAERALAIYGGGWSQTNHSYESNPEGRWDNADHYLRNAEELWLQFQPRVSWRQQLVSAFHGALARLRPCASTSCSNCCQPITGLASTGESTEQILCSVCSDNVG